MVPTADMLALVAKVRTLQRRAVDLVEAVAVETETSPRTVWYGWERLIEAGVIVPSTYRWPTAAGIALVQGA